MKKTKDDKQCSMYQVSTLQALAMGYTRTVVTVEELLSHGSIGLGTFEDVNGEMIIVDGKCYRAQDNGDIVQPAPETGVPFGAVAKVPDGAGESFLVENISDVEALKSLMTLKAEEHFGLNSMHTVRVDGHFKKVAARSVAPYKSQHVELKEILSKGQKDYVFNDIDGTLVCVYFPDYMDGINVAGWHLHFISKDRSVGGHVFDMELATGNAHITKISNIEIQVPEDPAFDTYSLKEASGNDIKKMEQGK